MPNPLFLLLALGSLLPLAAAAQAPPGPRNDSIQVDKSRYTLFNPTPRRYLRPLVPDRPGITESPFSVDAGHFQYETDVLRLLTRRENGTHGHDWYFNHALLKIGLTNRTDLQLKLNSYTTTRTEPDTAAASLPPEQHRGFGDVTLRLKHTLVGNDNSRVAVAALGYVLLPSGGPVGEGGVEVGAVVPVIVQLSRAASAGGQLAGELRYDRDAGRHYLQLVPTLTAAYQLTQLVQAFVELVGYRDVRASRWQASVSLGPQLALSDNVQLDFGAHLPLSAGIDHQYFLGISFRR